jgi:hypothetical protein
MNLVTHIDAAVRRLRAKTLVCVLCDLAGCRRSPYSLALWWQEHHQVVDVQLNRKWGTFFHGVTPRKDLREQMYADFPTLRALFDNPLWLALSDDAGRVDWDRLADGIRVGGQPLGADDSHASLLLYSRVDWPCLGLMIILLRTRARKFELHRKWLMLNFGALCGLACLQAPLAEIRLEVYGLLNNVLSQEPFDLTRFRYWPENAELFEQMLAWYRFFLGRIEARSWLEADANKVLLLWILLGQNDGLTVLGDETECRACKWPRSLRRLWKRQRKLWTDLPVTWDDYHVPAPV